jgi:hypothetical protein
LRVAFVGHRTYRRQAPDRESELAAMLGVPESELGDCMPRFNIAPTQPYFVLKTKFETYLNLRQRYAQQLIEFART